MTTLFPNRRIPGEGRLSTARYKTHAMLKTMRGNCPIRRPASHFKYWAIAQNKRFPGMFPGFMLTEKRKRYRRKPWQSHDC